MIHTYSLWKKVFTKPFVSGEEKGWALFSFSKYLEKSTSCMYIYGIDLNSNFESIRYLWIVLWTCYLWSKASKITLFLLPKRIPSILMTPIPQNCFSQIWHSFSPMRYRDRQSVPFKTLKQEGCIHTACWQSKIKKVLLLQKRSLLHYQVWQSQQRCKMCKLDRWLLNHRNIE